MELEAFLPVTYFPTNLVYPFTLRVTGIKTVQRSSQNALPRLSTSQICSLFISLLSHEVKTPLFQIRKFRSLTNEIPGWPSYLAPWISWQVDNPNLTLKWPRHLINKYCANCPAHEHSTGNCRSGDHRKPTTPPFIKRRRIAPPHPSTLVNF